MPVATITVQLRLSEAQFTNEKLTHMTRQLRILPLILAALLLCALPALAKDKTKDKKGKQPKEFINWPAGTTPQEIGKRVAERYVSQDYLNLRREKPGKSIIYPETCTWYGALQFAELTHDADLTKRLIARFDPLFGDKKSMIPTPNHVDYSVFGAVPLQIYRET